MTAPENRVPFGYVPTWLAFVDSKSDAPMRVLVALQAYGASAYWVSMPITNLARDIHRDKSTVNRAISWLIARRLLMRRGAQRTKQYRIILQPDETR